jgi:hypothetical protein
VRSAPDLGPQIGLQQAELTATDQASENDFGYAVAISGDTALVGAPWKTTNGDKEAGVVYVFTRSEGSWQQQTELTASDAFDYDFFGSSVALDGDTAIIGAPGKEMNSELDAGAAYVFTGSGSSWSQQAELTPSDEATWDHFGTAVAISGDTALVGNEPAVFSGVGKPGATYVFTRSDTDWSQQAELAASDASVGDGFGTSLALEGNTALIGAEAQTVAGTCCGAAYIFTGSGTDWSQQAELTSSDAGTDSGFGCSVALSGDTALVGALDQTYAGQSEAGAAYLFTGSGASWSQQAELGDPAVTSDDKFGSAVALDGGTALINDLAETVAGQSEAGAAYLYTGSGSNWTQQAELTASDPAASDFFGYALALSGDTALIGAPYKTFGTLIEAGAAYVDVLNDTVPLNDVAPVLSGSTAVGDALSCSTGSWTDYPMPSFSYQWLSDGSPIVGATSASYTVQDGDCGCSICCQVTASNMAGQASADSEAVQIPPAAVPSYISTAVLSGSGVLGGTLFCPTGTWLGNPAPSFTYQWLRDDSPIGGATSPSYAVRLVDCGHFLCCRVTATNSAGTASGSSSMVIVGAAPSPTLKASRLSFRVGRTVTLSGTVRHFLAGARTLTISRKLAGKLVLIKRMTISGTGAFRWAFKAKRAGRLVFVASYKAAGVTFRSKTVTLTIRQ